MDFDEFPSRKQLKKNNSDKSVSIKTDYDYLVTELNRLNLDDYDFENSTYDDVDTKIEKQKVYFWIRVYLSDELKDIEPNDDITIKYSVSGETLDTKFICFSKKGGSTENKDSEVVTNYTSEDDTKCLCLMVDEEKINYDSDDIPFLRKLFKIGRYYEYELIRRSDLILTNKRTNDKLDYYDIEF